MQFNIRGENIEVTEAIRAYVEKKVTKLTKYFNETPNSDVHVNLKVYNNEQSIEVTIPMKGLLLRAEERHTDLYAAIDLVVEKLERQIRKHKTKVNRKTRNSEGAKHMFATGTEGVSTALLDEEEEFEIVREKRFDFKPMDTEEAILQMDLLGHNFFVYNNAESGEMNVVYKRRDGKYGLIAGEV
ncbi:ribosome hibernation-promoting factor, HPF/YfiA family [Bacillus sp. NEB1478]|uniref:ribosome hibernation-promoting factor, HPF/YfiA family n=1 Tax=Bacillus sp. NEB1478 TaxID=3073816 RepID=UPI002872EC84|nr:ribosome-associated translation inhibitor RaiA [Bacillus sp. NEB1478]WNB92744.1 ribosome-associated translation inhibitor RaiA [Bacillus sp. NEB1478]